MINKGKVNILGTLITACDYAFLLSEISKAIKGKKELFIFPSATHSVTFNALNQKSKAILNKFDYVVPDSQWLRWSLNLLYGIDLEDRVYGPALMLKVCGLAEKQGWGVGLLGRKQGRIAKVRKSLLRQFPSLKIETYTEKSIGKIKSEVVFVGLGSPFQEEFTLEGFNGKDKVVIPVGAAFDFVSGVKPQAPAWMQNAGLEWFFRFIHEPRRLWKRYLIYAPAFVFLICLQKIFLIFNSE
jgi:exopolysaccharide biosynthesis WecB/TagA/CpsF family protein